MAKVKSKGTNFQLTISAVLTTIAQTTEVSTGATKNRVLDVECLDDSGVGVEMLNDGAVTQEEGSATLLYDPDGAGHQFITDSILTGATAYPIAGAWKWADATPASTTFSCVGMGFGASASVKGVLTAQVSVSYATYCTWPT